MSLPNSPADPQPNSPQDEIENDACENNPDELSQLPPRIPLNYKKTTKKNDHFPILDSAALFQSNSNCDNEQKSTVLLQNASSQIHLLSFKNDSNFFDGTGSIEEFTTIQKQSDFPPPDIKVDDYFIDLFCREIKSPQIKTKEEFLSAVEPYSIENYAKHNFRKRIFMFFNNRNIQQITTFSDKPLYKPLLEKIPLSKRVNVEVLSIQILTFIGVIKDKKKDEKNRESAEERRDNLLITIVCTLHEDETLIDECLMQLIRAMRNPPNNEKLILSWKLFLIILSLFYIQDEKVANVVRWFLVQKIFDDDMEAKYARFAFIKFNERNILARHFDNMTKTDIIHVPLGVSFGKKMFKSSLYCQMWNQKRKFPNLPIPLTLFLIVRVLIKNGVMMKPRPLPMFEGKYSGKTRKDAENESLKQASNESSKNENNSNDNQYEEIYDVEDNVEIEENANEIIKDENNKNDENENKNSAENIEKYKNQRRRADFKNIKIWSGKLSSNYDVINDGEVADLFGLLMIWMLNLLDPIVPKCMTQLFLDTFNNDPKEASSPEKYRNFVENIPLLHKNTLKYFIGFLREIALNEKFTLENHQTIADDLSSYFVNTTFATVDPFTRQKMTDVAPRFLFYCLESLDVSDIYPLNPIYTICVESQE